MPDGRLYENLRIFFPDVLSCKGWGQIPKIKSVSEINATRWLPFTEAVKRKMSACALGPFCLCDRQAIPWRSGIRLRVSGVCCAVLRPGLPARRVVKGGGPDARRVLPALCPGCLASGFGCPACAGGPALLPAPGNDRDGE